MVLGGRRVVAGLVGSIVGMMALVLFPASAVADPTGAQATLTAVSGTGSGKVVIAPTAEDHGTFAVQITVNVHGARPNRTYVINRAPDLNSDGDCTGAFMFTSTLVTSAGGAGAVHFDLHRGAPFVSGTKFDVKWQLLGDDGSQLVSDCLTVTVK
jgi:hypothetical protein